MKIANWDKSKKTYLIVSLNILFLMFYTISLFVDFKLNPYSGPKPRFAYEFVLQIAALMFAHIVLLLIVSLILAFTNYRHYYKSLFLSILFVLLLGFGTCSTLQSLIK